MGLEPPSRTGASIGADSPAHYRVRSRSCRGALLWLCFPDSWLALESRAVLRARLCASSRWHAALPCWQEAASDGTASRSGWHAARPLLRQEPRLARLSPARAMSMARDNDDEAAPGEPVVASPRHWNGSHPLEGLESPTLSAGSHAALSQPTGGGAGGTGGPDCPCDFACDPVACAAGPLSALVGRAASSQCPSSRSFSREDQAVRHSSSPGRFARSGNGLTPLSRPLCCLSSDEFASPSASFWPVSRLFLASPPVLPCALSTPLLLPPFLRTPFRSVGLPPIS